MELLVHIDYERALEPYTAIPITFGETLLLNVSPESLSENWAEPEGLPTTQAIGDAWVKRNASVLLAVPSRVVAAERNYLFNPNHPDAGRVEIGEAQAFNYDPRLLKR